MSVLIRIAAPRRRERPSVSGGRRWRIAVMVATMLGVSGPVWGQDSAPDTSVGASSEVVAQAGAGESSAAGISSLPPPATDRAYLHVFLAFGIAWALILGYVVLLNRRIAAAERDVGRLSDRGA